jgi:hypothetical protein
MDARLLTDKQISMVSERDRRALGILTYEERMKKLEAKNGRELTKQIVQYLQLRGLEVCWSATHKKSTMTKAWPDISFAAMVNGFPTPIAYEVKFGKDMMSREQSDRCYRMQTAPNAWRVRIISNFIEVVDDLRDLGL